MKTNLIKTCLPTLVLAACLLSGNRAIADVEQWVGIPGTSTSTNWSDTANWSGTSHNPNDNAVNFMNNGPAVPGTVDNVVDISTNCYSLSFTNTTTSHTTLIQPGQTLTIDGANSTGVSLVANPNGQAQTTNTITGANGTLVITGVSAGSVFVATTNSSAGNVAPVLDLSGLGTFILSNVASASTVWVGAGANRSDGQLFLAKTNYLALPGTGTGTSSALTVGANTSNNGSSPGGTMLLGQTNTILADNIGVGLAKQTSASIRFNPVVTNGGANPVVYIRGFSGTAVKKWSIGDGLVQTGTSVGGTGSVDFRNGTVNAIVNVLVMGRPSPPSSTAPTSTGTLSLSAGSISVTILTNGWMTQVAGVGATPTNQTASATINITGTASFSAANVFMANALGTGGTDNATFNVTNGTLAVGTITLGGGNSTNNLNNGTFIVTNTVGTPAAPLTALNLTGGTIQLNLNGSGTIPTNICATTVTTSGTTTIAIGSISGVTSTTTFPLISYSGTDPYANLTLAPLPNGFTGSLSDDSGKIDLIVNPPAAANPVVWVGATNATLVSNWDTATTNWVDTPTRSVPSAYMDLDPVQFDDTASNNIVTLLTNVAPYSILVTNDSLNYNFNGTGKISGTTGLIKDGPGSLTLAESGGDSFTSGIIVSNGTLVLDNAGSGISGGLDIVAGTVRIGNADANGNLPAGAVTDNGNLIFNRTDNFAVSTAISGTGSLTKTGNNTLTLSGGNSYAGGLLVNAGTLRLSGGAAQGTGAITVTNTGTVVLSQAILNPVILSGGILGESASINPLTNDLTVVAGTTTLVFEADPQNLAPGDANEMTWSNTLSGAGNIIVASVTNDPSADSGNGFRLRGTTPSTFSGSITLSNGVKGELQTTVAGPFSPAGSGTIQLVCGNYLGNNSTSNSLPNTGAYTEFNIRNNGSGDTTFGNNVVILGSGYTAVDPLGSAPAGSTITMGNLTAGNGQEVGTYLSAAPSHIVVFPTVSLTGGTIRFSPKTPGFGATTSAGANMSFGTITETAPSSIVMNGLLTLTLTGNNTYSGTTTISNGTLEVDGANLGTGSVTVEAGATLDGTGMIAGPMTVAAGGTLSPGNGATPTATLSISNSLALSGTNIMDVNKTGITFANDVITNITTLTYGGILQLNLTGTALASGDAIKLYSCNSTTGAFAEIIPAAPGTGLLWNTNTLATGVLSVVSAVNTSPTNITTMVSGNTLTLSWPTDHIGWRLQVQTNALATGLYTNWTDVPGSTTVDSVNTTIDPANGAVFYRMVYP